ncbi:MAG: hypothetical protein MK240_11430, partial [Opitutales bacterium]|nr:hypothetical protein [Opitutales bacterium]
SLNGELIYKNTWQKSQAFGLASCAGSDVFWSCLVVPGVTPKPTPRALGEGQNHSPLFPFPILNHFLKPDHYLV